MRDLRAGGLAGRRRAAPRGQPRPAGAHPGHRHRGVLPAAGPAPGSSRRCSRPAGGRRPGPRRARGPTDAAAADLARRRAARGGRRRAGDAPPDRRQACRRASVDREIKRGPGGLRDIEFAVQLLQLVHGRGDETLRSGTTLDGAAGAGRAAGYVGRADGGGAARALPLPADGRAPRCSCRRLRRTHTGARRPGGAALAGARARAYQPDARRDAVEAFRADWVATPARYAGCTPSCSTGRCWRRWPGCPATTLRLTPEAARRPPGGPRLRRPRRRAAAPAGAHRRRDPHRRHPAHAAAGAAATSSRTPPSPTAACSATARCPRSSAARPGTCGCCATRARWPQRLARLLGLSRYVTDLLARDPRGAAAARRRRRADPARPPEALRRGLRPRRPPGHDDPARRAIAGGPRALRRRELFRIACADLLGRLAGDVAGATSARSALPADVADATLRRALRAACTVSRCRHGCRSPSSGWAGWAGTR